MLAIAVTLSTTFTASSNVSVSSAGASTQVRTIAQLTPAGCNSLSLTSLVRGTGSFSNSISNALVLGGSGNDTITDTGSHNCIVPGGGTNHATGTATDICVTGPTLNIAGACASASNGVTATPSNQNYANYGGQELLSLDNTNSITSLTITIKIAQNNWCWLLVRFKQLPLRGRDAERKHLWRRTDLHNDPQGWEDHSGQLRRWRGHRTVGCDWNAPPNVGRHLEHYQYVGRHDVDTHGTF